MQQDAFVIVVDAGASVKLTEAKQMLGRSSRRRGFAIGKVLIRKNEDDMGKDGRQILKGRNQEDPDAGDVVLRAIVKYARAENEYNLSQIARAIKTGWHSWRLTDGELG